MAEDELVEVVSVSDIARQFDVNASTVRRMIYKREFPGAFKFSGVWKVPKGDVDDYLLRQKEQALEKQRGGQSLTV